MSARLGLAESAGARGDLVVALDTGDPHPDPALAPGGSTAVRGPAAAGLLVAARRQVLETLLEEAERRGARAAVLLRAGPGGAGLERLPRLAEPVLDSAFDYVAAAHGRHRLAGMLNTAIVAPLVRALYGRRVRQPCGGEAALSLALVRALRADPERWRAAGPGWEAWLAATALGGRWRVAQAWVGRWPGDWPRGEDPSHALDQVVAPVFEEMARSPDRWQRVERSEPVPTFGAPDEDGEAHEAHPAAATGLEEAFRLGVRELSRLWSEVLPPAAMLALGRAAACDPPRLEDALWARIVYDFAVAFSLRTVERHQLLRSMTPLYLGWVAGFARDVRTMDGAAADARLDALGDAFEREKPYVIRRWRWPDGFNP